MLIGNKVDRVSFFHSLLVFSKTVLKMPKLNVYVFIFVTFVEKRSFVIVNSENHLRKVSKIYDIQLRDLFYHSHLRIT